MAPWAMPDTTSPRNWAPVRPVASELAQRAKKLSVLISWAMNAPNPTTMTPTAPTRRSVRKRSTPVLGAPVRGAQPRIIGFAPRTATLGAAAGPGGVPA